LYGKTSATVLDVLEGEVKTSIEAWFKAFKPIAISEEVETKDAQSRMRYRYRNHDESIDPMWFERVSQYRCACLYGALLKHYGYTEELEMVKTIWAAVGDGFTTRLGDFTGMIKKYREQYHSKWFIFCELEDMQDFASPITDEEVYAKVLAWIDKPVEHELKGFNFLDLYGQGCDEFLSYGTTLKKRPISVMEFLSDPMYWATPGTSYGPRLEVDGVKTRRSKWATAYASSPIELLRLFMDDEPQTNKAIVKREHKKSRMIIAGDLANYLRMTYLSYYIDDALDGHPNTTLFMNTDQQIGLYAGMGAPKKAQEVNMPIDESKFDHMVNIDMMKVKFNSLRKFLEGLGLSNLLWVLDLISTSLFSSRANVTVGRRKIYYRNGLLSGWRWTAFLGTLSNQAKVFMFRRVMASLSGVLDTEVQILLRSVGQGDDVRTRFINKEAAAVFFGLYDSSGFEVHDRKTFVADNCDEFLRNFAYEQVVAGYPARGIANLLYRNPINMEKTRGSERIFESISSWFSSFRRFRSERDAPTYHVYRDISQGNGITLEDAKNVVHAPSCFGGAGVAPYIMSEIIMTKAIITRGIKYPPAKVTGFIDQGMAEKIWQAGIDPGPKVSTSVVPFKLEVRPISSDMVKYVCQPFFTKPDVNFRNITGYTLNDQYRPTDVAIIGEMIKKANTQELRTIVLKYFSPESTVKYLSTFGTASTRMIKALMTGDIIGKIPVLLKVGGLVASQAYRSAVCDRLLSLGTKLLYRTVKRIQFQTEVDLTRGVLTEGVRVLV